MATAVISANEAMHYASTLFDNLPIIIATILLLSLFMGLSIIGIGESSKVAIAIFLFHLTSLILLSTFIGIYLFNNGFDIFSQNAAMPVKSGSISMALFFGFSAAMLGISGFESSANFVEEQEKGVFPKTLRNMWFVVTIFNPLMAFFALSVLPIPWIEGHQNALLSDMGEIAGGSWLSIMISIDATLVLSGAVLTSYVGVTGLVKRMTLDRVLPAFLLKKNKRGSSYLIAIAFFILCVSILLITQGQLKALAGVYTIAFLSVMVLFGFGNILLKIRRKNLPRPEKSSWLSLLIAIIAVIAAIIGNAVLNPPYLIVLFEYFVPTMLLVMIMLNRVLLLKLFLQITTHILKPIQKMLKRSTHAILRSIDTINSQEFVYFTKNDSVETLNKVMLYIQNNEHTKKLKIVTVHEGDEKVSEAFLSDLDVLDREYPAIKIELIELTGSFGPDLINKLSAEWNIPVNFMLIGSPGDHFPYKIEQMGGVRLII